MSILDLPIEQQKKIAVRCGMTYAEWVAGVQKSMQHMREFSNKHPVRRIVSINEASPYQQLIQRRMDAETPSKFDVVMP